MKLNRLSLNVVGLNRIGLNQIGSPSRGSSSGTDRPYIDPEVLASLKAVCICYGKSNDDPDRAVVKNLVDPDNPFVISNAAFKLNSGFGEYSADFESFDWAVNISQKQHNKATISLNGRLCNHTAIEVDEMKVNIIGNVTELIYWYIANPDDTTRSEIRLTSGINTLPKSYAKDDGQTYNIGFAYISGDSEITIEQIPSFEGAFVTDGVNDTIISTKTLAEMGITDEVTVVSMIHQIALNSTFNNGFTNYIENLDKSSYVRNNIYNTGKTGIYGYSASLINRTASNINDILGDKKDYGVEIINRQNTLNSTKFSVIGRASSITEVSSVAWYWTIIANKVLATDQINQVIAYFNLDRTLKPDILCNTIKQGITNENHAEFGDKLIDFSGNGRDIQMYNLAWKGGSGIAAKPYETIKDYKQYEDNLYQEVIIHNEFSYTTKSKLADRYWAIQSNRKDNESLVVTIITDKDCEWICNSQLFNSEGVQEGNLKKKQNVFANTPTEVTIAGRGYFEIPEGYTTYSAASYINLPYSNGEVTVTFIPSCKGGILLDGINDFGKVIDMPIYKDYTFISKYQRLSYREAIETEGGAVIASKSYSPNQGAFIFNGVRGDYVHDCYSFGLSSSNNLINDKNLEVYYQTKYTNQGKSISSGTAADSDILWLGTVRDNDTRFINAAIYFLMSFPYSMSKFLIERQLKKYKLGTLYPNMVEFRPIVKSNSEYQVVGCYIDTLPAVVGNYYPINSKLRIAVTTKGAADEVTSLTVNGVSLGTPSVKGNRFTFNGTLSDKSPQKINITIDEYIRYEDIVQPYPVLLRFNDENGNEVSWGGKFRVGSTITRIGSIADPESNLLNGLYSISGLTLNGKAVTSSISIVEKQMVFKTTATWLLDNNEPNCILSTRLLRMPNSSYKILGHIPDISGHGNHGVIHNSAYAKGSGVNEDGSYQFDGVDDFVTIPTLSGGKQVLMKVNWQKEDTMIYNQNPGEDNFAIFANDYNNNNLVNAYASRNNGSTYIDGILNNNILATQLKNVTHNITITNENVINNTIIPVIGANAAHNNFYSQMALYDFMLFDNISTEDKIKELNEYVGIEAKVELPPYYWDAYGKTNLDADKATIQQRGVAVGDYDLTNYNHAYDKMSGYGGYEFAKFDNVLDWYLTPNNNHIDVVSRNGYEITLKNLSTSVYGWYFQNSRVIGFITRDIPFKVKANKSIRVYWDMHSYKISSGEAFGHVVSITTLNPNEDTSISLRHLTEEELVELDTNKDRMYYLLWFDLSTLAVDEEVTIEMLPLYTNGLAYDGITDYSKNANIPAFDDFTAIMKRKWLKKQGCPLIKGSKVYEGGNGNALLLEWDKAYNFVFYKRTDIMEGELPDNISFITPTNYNGNVITRGSEQDTNGICIAGDGNAGFANMVFYKLILYPKTIPLLQINFLKNLMERDEIIDLNNPIFIQE